jgi:hypothetical protein
MINVPGKQAIKIEPYGVTILLPPWRGHDRRRAGGGR